MLCALQTSGEHETCVFMDEQEFMEEVYLPALEDKLKGELRPPFRWISVLLLPVAHFPARRSSRAYSELN